MSTWSIFWGVMIVLCFATVFLLFADDANDKEKERTAGRMIAIIIVCLIGIFSALMIKYADGIINGLGVGFAAIKIYLWFGLLAILEIAAIVSIILCGKYLPKNISDYRFVQKSHLSYATKRESKKMIKLLAWAICSLIIFGSISYYSYNLLENNYFSTEAKLKIKIANLTDLKIRLVQKQKEVVNLIGEYQQGIDQLKTAIKNEAKQKNISSFDAAIANKKIGYSISLVQEKEAYIFKLQSIDLRLNEGIYEIEYLEGRAQDDLKMVKVLDSAEAKKIISDIKFVIGKYLPDAEKLVINIDEKNMQKPEQIWEEIIRGK